MSYPLNFGCVKLIKHLNIICSIISSANTIFFQLNILSACFAAFLLELHPGGNFPKTYLGSFVDISCQSESASALSSALISLSAFYFVPPSMIFFRQLI